ncbi:hypothetical protein F511_11784 [Dorcoceras hygrometricum]|uniref:Uncharacterized protein n=1 Tax=Dorcoceras hygrometricum TaxID=472368 RepID=A0A2Z7CKT1_9LAMI|nr:hypothetical protein F511_11784 [Dorcoceras hygrometricum]
MSSKPPQAKRGTTVGVDSIFPLIRRSLVPMIITDRSEMQNTQRSWKNHQI